ncbi:MAG: hypothetical protein MHPSP_002890, partial [Paramarteilia canceri]
MVTETVEVEKPSETVNVEQQEERPNCEYIKYFEFKVSLPTVLVENGQKFTVYKINYT